MSTSLQDQLRRLAVPQTASLVIFSRKASIIFETKEAASKDRRTIYDLGIEGLQSLIALNVDFKEFEGTLFERTSIYFERSVEQSDLNKILDKNITKFLRLLSPYFLLRSSHLCLEWLIRRYHIHEYNRDALLALILPYYDTNIFIKVIQTIRIRKGDEQWDWLKPMQSSGVSVPKSTIINKASANNHLFSFVCSHTLKTVQLLGNRANILQAHISFFTSLAAGVLESNKSFKEWRISSLLPYLLNGLRSHVLDLQASSYVLTGILVKKTQVTLTLCNSLLNFVANNINENLRETAVLLLIIIFESQRTIEPEISNESLFFLAKQDWFSQVLCQLVKKKYAIAVLLNKLVIKTVKQIQIDEKNSQDLKKFIERMISEINLKHSESLEFVRCFLVGFQKPHKKQMVSGKNVIEVISDEEMDKENFIEWYAALLKTIERKYPLAFDKVIKTELQSHCEQNSQCSKAISMVLAYRLRSTGIGNPDAFECLYHYSAPIRLQAVKNLLQNMSIYESRSNKQLLKDCLADRIKDESAAIVFEVLKLPVEKLIDILGLDEFVDSLRLLIYKSQFDTKLWEYIIEPVVNLLITAEIIATYDQNLILLLLMPILFPDTSESMNINLINSVLTSPLNKKFIFLRNLSSTTTTKTLTFDEYKSIFLQELSRYPLNIKSLFKSLNNFRDVYIKNINELTSIIILATADSKTKISAEECLEYFQYVIQCCEMFDKNLVTISQMQTNGLPNRYNLLLFSDFVLSLVKNTDFQKLSDFSETNRSLLCFLSLFEYLLNKVFQHKNKAEWMRIIKDLFNSVFMTAGEKIIFLENFCYMQAISLPINYKIVQACGLRILLLILSNKDNSYLLHSKDIFKILIGLSSESEIVRILTLKILQYVSNFKKTEDYLAQFIQKILEAKTEISMDSEQLGLILFTILGNSKPKKKPTMSMKVLNEMTFLATDEVSKNAFLKFQLLKIMKHINSEAMIVDFLPLGNFVLNQSETKERIQILKDPYDQILKMILERFTSNFVGRLFADNIHCWNFFENVFGKIDVFLIIESKICAIPCAALTILDETTFAEFPQNFKDKFLKILIKAIALSDNDELFLAANKFLKRCSIDCQFLAEIIVKMYEESNFSSLTKSKRDKKQKKEAICANINITSAAWKEGLVLIELLENKKNLKNSFCLIVPLFELLRACVEIDEELNAEYIKQITLSLLLLCCKTVAAEGLVLKQEKLQTIFRVDYVVQCLRSSHNPQTHNNALLLLSHCANIVPQQVLTEIVAIFTFMGSSVVRKEDAFSYHIINNIISSIIPILVMNNDKFSDNLVISVLKVFSDIMLDVPEHRRLLLYSKLLHALGSEKYLWMFLCVLFEAHVVGEENEKKNQKKNLSKMDSNGHNLIDDTHRNEKVNKRMETALELTNTFEPQIIVVTLTSLLTYIQKLPIEIQNENNSRIRKTNSAEVISNKNSEQCIFDMTCRSAKELRHYRYIILQFIGTISGSQTFLQSVASLPTVISVAMKTLYQNLIIKTLSCIPLVNSALQRSKDQSQNKFWKVILNNLHDILDNAISLLSPEMFVLVITGLMQHQILSIRRKVIELLVHKLQKYSEFFNTCQPQDFDCLLKLLSNNVDFMLKNTKDFAGNSEFIQIHQSTLIAIKLFAKHFGKKLMQHLQPLLDSFLKVLKKRSEMPKLMSATIVLTTVEIICCLKAHALAQLTKFTPHLISILLEQSIFLEEHLPDNTCSVIISATQKLVETVPLFLGRYTPNIIVVLSKISTNAQNSKSNGKDVKSIAILQRIDIIWNRMATIIPSRNLVPHCCLSYNTLLKEKKYAEINFVVFLLKQCIQNSTNTELIVVQPELTDFFMQGLEFRHQMSLENLEQDDLTDGVENEIIAAFTSWVLKMSESNFRPIYHQIYNWAFIQIGSTKTKLTYFRLAFAISEALKTLFVLFVHEFVNDSAQILNECILNNVGLLDVDSNTKSQLIRFILATLTNVFIYDNKQFVSSIRFETLMRPIISQLENELVLCNADLQENVTKCIAHLAVAVSNDVLWKQLNYEVLMKTRSNIPEVRILSLNCVVEIAKKLGDDFSTLLPETIPFIAELFEDENPKVETNTRKSVQKLESILGESLQKYL